MAPMTPVPASASHVEMTQLVMPSHANSHGTAFGGTVMAWTDLAAGMAAMRHARLPVVTASIDQLVFRSPVRIGQIALLRAQVNAVFATSMEVGVLVLTEEPLTGEQRLCCEAFLTFVALGPDHHPRPVPPLLVETELERQRQREAVTRRAARLELREALRRR
jgi:acyl-CoA hydrolase